MNKETLYEIAEIMADQIGAQALLDELLYAMDIDELKANLEFIDRTHDLNNFDEIEDNN